MATIIRADGTVVHLAPAQDSEDGSHKVLSLDQMQKAVGGHIEIVYVSRNVPGRVLPRGRVWGVCNEEGKLRGLPRNRTATNLWYEACDRAMSDYLVGDIVILDRPDEIE